MYYLTFDYKLQLYLTSFTLWLFVAYYLFANYYYDKTYYYNFDNFNLSESNVILAKYYQIISSIFLAYALYNYIYITVFY